MTQSNVGRAGHNFKRARKYKLFLKSLIPNQEIYWAKALMAYLIKCQKREIVETRRALKRAIQKSQK